MKCKELMNGARVGFERSFLVTFTDIDEMKLPYSATIRGKLRSFSDEMGDAIYEMFLQVHKKEIAYEENTTPDEEGK